MNIEQARPDDLVGRGAGNFEMGIIKIINKIIFYLNV
jgi:hypothetical protein